MKKPFTPPVALIVAPPSLTIPASPSECMIADRSRENKRMKGISFRNLLFFLVIVFALLGGAALEAHELKIDESFDDSGRLFQRTSYYGSYVKHGTQTRWDASGRIIEQIEYRDGRMNGLYTEWGYHDDRGGFQFIRKSGEYINDIKEGEWYGTSSINGGSLYSAYFFANDIQEGKQEEYFSDGRLDGSYKSYYENGRLQGVSGYDNGKAHGAFTDYYEAGGIELLHPSRRPI